MMKKNGWFILFILVSGIQCLYAQSIFSNKPSGFKLSEASIIFDSADLEVVQTAVYLLQSDIEKVTSKKPALNHELNRSNPAIIIGSTNNSAIIQQLLLSKKINIKAIDKKWEAFTIQYVKNYNNKNNDALVIIGSDGRGTAFGIFTVSRQMGVSPWNWWADVPVIPNVNLYVNNTIHFTDAPKVKYRGIFINDEAPALSNWSKEKFGGFNHKFYDKVFELMLRLNANYIWPAMWGSAFYDDDSLNINIAKKYAIVIGTSHHEPLMRAHDEWRRYGGRQWNYQTNPSQLDSFWTKGMQRATNEKIVTIGMRGDGDEPMSEGTATALLETIVEKQRSIIAQTTGKAASETPQIWALYKEVQDYYDKGMRVPDDVTLLICDDNWGNIRRLPKPDEKPRKGGYGIYYHFDYVGGPRNYKWINTNHIPRIWEQMNLAWKHNVNNLWIVNVGDIKPMELPISFFLEQAWNPERFNQNNLTAFVEKWSTEQLGNKHQKSIAQILNLYTKYNARITPELLDQNTFSLINYDEFNRVTKEYNSVKNLSDSIFSLIPAAYKNAYFQLVQYPVEASANLYNMYYNVARNHFNYKHKIESITPYPRKVQDYFLHDATLTRQYHELNNGKWNHMMSQTHIGYTYWQQPEYNVMPTLYHFNFDSAKSIEKIMLPILSINNKKFVPKNAPENTFFQNENYVSIEAASFTRNIAGKNARYVEIPNLGKTISAITTHPVTISNDKTDKETARVEYDFYNNTTGKAIIRIHVSPTLNLYHEKEGLQLGVSLNNEPVEFVSLNKNDGNVDTLEHWQANSIITRELPITINKQGKQTLKLWHLSPGVVIQKIVIYWNELKPSFLGPPETKIQSKN